MNRAICKLLSCFIFNKGKRKAFRAKHLKASTNQQLSELRRQLQKQDEDLSQIKQILETQLSPESIPPAKGINRTIQLLGLEVLKDIDYVCRKHNIPYWLDFGTLLGAVRHKGFIPWDDDIDIGMMWEDCQRFMAVAHELKNSVCFTAPGQWIKVAHKDFSPSSTKEAEGIFLPAIRTNDTFHIAVDIFPHCYLKENLTKEEAKQRIQQHRQKKNKELHPLLLQHAKSYDDLKHIETKYHHEETI